MKKLQSKYYKTSLGNIHFLYKQGYENTIVFLHGIPGNSKTWERTANGLSKNYEIIIPDLLGFGKSDINRQNYYMEAQVQVLKEVLHYLKINKFAFVSHDFGGPVAISFLQKHSEFEISGLVLCNTNCFTDTYIPPPLRLAKVPVINQIFFKMMAGNKFALKMMYKKAVVNKKEFTKNMFCNYLNKKTIWSTQHIFLKSLSNLKKNYDKIEKSLSQINIPTLVIWGDKDPFFALDVGVRTSQSIKGALLNVYKNTGHFVPEEQSKRFAKNILDFL